MLENLRCGLHAKYRQLFNPFPPSVPIWYRLAKKMILNEEGIIKQIFPWVLPLWVGRRKDPILGYVPKSYENY